MVIDTLMELLDLCPDLFEKVIDDLYKARERDNRKHMTYIMNHARTLTFCRWGQKVPRRLPFGYNHVQRMLLFQNKNVVYGLQFVSPKLSRGTLIKAMRDNQIISVDTVDTHPSIKKLNREKLCALLLKHGVVFHPHRMSMQVSEPHTYTGRYYY